ncbi:DUF3325 domain-containing protein [Pusillimonas sp.]|uniref:DUF3325 domain-containing protein n=1 Tax=Pusillimonas sp. TaxID=3040095 RepID=UPI0037C824DF
MNWTSLLLGFCGLTLLALRMERHREQVWGDRPLAAAPFVFTSGGWLLLGLAAIPPISRHGASIGLAVWAGELTIAAMAVVLLHTYAPRRVPSVLAAVAAVALAATLITESLM